MGGQPVEIDDSIEEPVVYKRGVNRVVVKLALDRKTADTLVRWAIPLGFADVETVAWYVLRDRKKTLLLFFSKICSLKSEECNI